MYQLSFDLAFDDQNDINKIYARLAEHTQLVSSLQVTYPNPQGFFDVTATGSKVQLTLLLRKCYELPEDWNFDYSGPNANLDLEHLLTKI